jgi:large subunit ribosomal protein L40e
MFDDIGQRVEESTIGKPIYVRAKIYESDDGAYVEREFNSTLLSKEASMITISIKENPYSLSIINRNILTLKGTATAASNMEIFIELHSGETFTLFVESSDTIENIKAKVQDKKGFAPDRERLLYEGLQLEDGRTLSDYKIGHHSVVHVELMSV